MKKFPQRGNFLPGVSQMHPSANLPLQNICREQTYQYKDQQPPVMRTRTRALRFQRSHALQSIKRPHSYVLSIIISMENTERFTGRAAMYERYRLRYPPDTILQLLRAWCGLEPNW